MSLEHSSSRAGAVVAAAFSLLAAGHAAGQSFNIDFGAGGAPSGAGVPAAAFGGPAGQAGVWNGIPGGDPETLTYPLNDITGAATGVTIESTIFARGATLNARPETAGTPAAALLDDFFFLDGDVLSEFAVLGLQPGEYDLYVIGIRVGDPGEHTSVTWLSEDLSDFQDDLIGDAAYSGAFVQGVTHARFRVPVGPSGELRFLANGVFSMTVESFGVVNGLQIVRVPAPSAAAVVIVGVLSTLRRRRGA